MPDDRIGTAPGATPAGQIPVSANNPCPFLRALVANGYVGGHVVPLSKLSEIVGIASGANRLWPKRRCGWQPGWSPSLRTVSGRCAC